MLTFSQRLGYTPVRTAIQKESADEPLRNALWNLLFKVCFEDPYNDNYFNLLQAIWIRFFGKRIDEFSTNLGFPLVRKSFLTDSWYEMYNLLEIMPRLLAEIGNNDRISELLTDRLNEILKKHLSAYRFIDGKIIEITSEEEIAEIEQAINTSRDDLAPVKSHLIRSLELLSDRSTPDYRNSIKESISAIESLSCIITQEPKATLGQALKIIESSHNLHPALKGAFEKLYGYTSDSEGIRHALLEESTLKQEDAKFMLVTCSAFINYLIAKTSLA